MTRTTAEGRRSATALLVAVAGEGRRSAGARGGGEGEDDRDTGVGATVAGGVPLKRRLSADSMWWKMDGADGRLQPRKRQRVSDINLYPSSGNISKNFTFFLKVVAFSA